MSLSKKKNWRAKTKQIIKITAYHARATSTLRPRSVLVSTFILAPSVSMAIARICGSETSRNEPTVTIEAGSPSPITPLLPSRSPVASTL
jgi:hypothetical protein